MNWEREKRPRFGKKERLLKVSSSEGHPTPPSPPMLSLEREGLGLPCPWAGGSDFSKKKGTPPLVSEEDVIQVIVGVKQLLGDLFVGHPGDQLHNPLLHRSASAVQLLGEQTGRRLRARNSLQGWHHKQEPEVS